LMKSAASVEKDSMAGHASIESDSLCSFQ
jgi:hypothetical protein